MFKESALADKYDGYFGAFKDAVDQLVELIKNFTDIIKGFVEGFKKTITKGEDFEY